MCQKNEKQWSKINIDNFIDDLRVYEDRLGELNIIGGNIINYGNLEYLFNRISFIENINVRINLLYFKENLNNIYEFINKLFKFKFQKIINFKVYFDNDIKKNILKLDEIKKIQNKASSLNIKTNVELLIDRINEEVLFFLEESKKRFQYLDWEFMYDYNLNNVENLRLNNIDIFTESINFDEFYFRKNSHRCWGFSFAINSAGEIKPCLWSQNILDKWENGRIKHYLYDFNKTFKFWIDSALKNNNTCGKSGLRFCCKHCKVVEEYKKDIFSNYM